jgi:SpoVK/Ycf46/Vps4 family AAA+-type ATPase
VDVVFVLTTNRVEVLERALAERPGRVDEAVEVGPPDDAGRERLLRLYAGSTGIEELDLSETVAATDGATATYLRELVRRTVVTAALARPEEDLVRVRQADLAVATEELRSSRARLTRALLGVGRGITEPSGRYQPQEDGWMVYGPPLPAPFHPSAGETVNNDPGAVPPGWDDREP